METPRLKIVKKDLSKSNSVTPKDEQRGTRCRMVTGRASPVPAVLTVALALTAGGPAHGADNSAADFLAGLLGQNKPVICHDQTYALCAGARCFVFNDVAYCTCDVLEGNSISAPFKYDSSNVCSLKRFQCLMVLPAIRDNVSSSLYLRMFYW